MCCAYRLVGTMNAPYPTTRAALPRPKFHHHSFDVVFSCFRSLNRNGPTDPFIASQGRNVLPGKKCFFGRQKCFSHIVRQCMSCTAGNSLFNHRTIVANQLFYYKIKIGIYTEFPLPWKIFSECNTYSIDSELRCPISPISRSSGSLCKKVDKYSSNQ